MKYLGDVHQRQWELIIWDMIITTGISQFINRFNRYHWGEIHSNKTLPLREPFVGRT
jgi:hypothetical protein